MPSYDEKVSYSTIYSVIRDKMVNEKWIVSDTFKDEPRLPIDLFCSKFVDTNKESGEDINDYHVFIFASIKDVSKHFQHLLGFCRFFLTFKVKPSPRDLKLTLVITSDAHVEEEDHYKEYGFGLWKIIKGKDSEGRKEFNVAVINEPVPFRDKQIEAFTDKFKKPDEYLDKEELNQRDKFANAIKQLEETASNNQVCEFIARHFDEYILDAGEAILEYKPIDFDERLFDKKLLMINTLLKHVSYNKELFEYLNEHLSQKTNDLEFCVEKVNRLWIDYIDSRGFPIIQERAEAFLKELLPSYREHFLHQFQDFLIGTCIIDGLLENNYLDKEDRHDLCKSWLLAATFHDFTYCIQEYDKWSGPFLKEMLNIGEQLGSLELKRHYIENKFMSSVENILSALSNCLTLPSGNEVEALNELRFYFYKQMTEKRNHAVISSLTLYKRFENLNKDDFNNVYLPACLSIILHDDEIWQTLYGLKMKDSENQDWINDVREIKPLKCLSFKDYPISFLLLLCDNLHDWGRPFKNTDLNELTKEADVHLKDININGSGVDIEVYFNVNAKTKPLLNHKKEIWENLSNLLVSTFPLRIKYLDSQENIIKDCDFTIKSQA